ncbi:MAG: hypothetical protein FP816_21755 [Desulfobacteraceae bacterium]|nr:hypothetical protein [Desulfobacteraceae bacterium]MBU4054069.1 hypothetical protein [Pseudomonadota bacterium]
MAKVFRPSTRESNILSKIESSKNFARRKSLDALRDCKEDLSNAISMKLVENKLVETTSKNAMEAELVKCLDKLSFAEDFDVEYQAAPFRNVVQNPNIISLYVTAFVIEQLINHKNTVDIFGSDEEIYNCINKQVSRYLPGNVA